MVMKRTFSITLILFIFVWAFAALDSIGKRRVKPASLGTGSSAQSRPFRAESSAGVLANASFAERRISLLSGGSSSIQLLADSQEIQFLAENPAIAAQVQEIDRQITELQAMKRGFEARALRHEDYAQRLQFEDRAVLETRRHLELADENRAKADRVQQEIDRLQIERRKLLKSG